MLQSLLILGAYLVGSIPFPVLITKWLKGIDVRDHGSGNMGTTNVLRVVGKGAGALALLADMSKGLITVLLAGMLEVPSIDVGLVALATVLGHIYPLFAGFRGGKGVATGLGAFLGMMPFPTLIAMGIWMVFLALFRYVSLSSILASLSLPLIAFFLSYPTPKVAFALLIALLISYRHQENIRHLLAGTEDRFGTKEDLKEKAL
jgi:glycerol-3-phosphate acyltransferase PlsY